MTEHKSVNIIHSTKMEPGAPVQPPPGRNLHMNMWPKRGDTLRCGNGHPVFIWVGPDNPTDEERMLAENYIWPSGKRVERGTPTLCSFPGCDQPMVLMVRKAETK